jgi:hypothetical protein
MGSFGLMTPGERSVLAGSLHTIATSGDQAIHYVELGIKRAETSAFIYGRLCKLRSAFHFYAIDLDPKAEKCFQKRVGARLKKGCSAKMMLCSSEDAAKAIWPSISWIFVDACHCFECANHDIEKWGRVVAPGGHMIIHDTTRRRLHYTKNFQHNHTRPFGVAQAVESNRFLKDRFRLLKDLDDKNGIQVYEKLSHEQNGDDSNPVAG